MRRVALSLVFLISFLCACGNRTAHVTPDRPDVIAPTSTTTSVVAQAEAKEPEWQHIQLAENVTVADSMADKFLSDVVSADCVVLQLNHGRRAYRQVCKWAAVNSTEDSICIMQVMPGLSAGIEYKIDCKTFDSMKTAYQNKKK